MGDDYDLIHTSDADYYEKKKLSVPEQTYLESTHRRNKRICLILFIIISISLSVTTIIVTSVKRNNSIDCYWDTPEKKRIIVFGTFDAFIGDPEAIWNIDSYTSYYINRSSWNLIEPSLFYHDKTFSKLTVNTQKRYSDRMSWIDLIAENNRMRIASPFDDNALDMKSVIFPYSIAGSFAEGNIYDEDGNMNIGYQRLVSDASYELQVTNLAHNSMNYNYEYDDYDNLFIYSGVGFIDIMLLSFESGNDSIDFNIEHSVQTHVRLIRKLYDLGMRRILITIADPDFYSYLPLVTKNILNASSISYIAEKYNNRFINLFFNDTKNDTYFLDYTIIKYSDIIRSSINSGISLNPTIYDYIASYKGKYKKDLVFMDDFNWSEATSRSFYLYFIEPWLRLQIGECQIQLDQ